MELVVQKNVQLTEGDVAVVLEEDDAFRPAVFQTLMGLQENTPSCGRATSSG
jgi:hypothetical protein